MYVEMHWNAGAQNWVPVQFTEWLAYGQAHRWLLHPAVGMRYLQVWVADKTGNISAAPTKIVFNYVPGENLLLAGETQILRTHARAGQCLQVTVTPTNGDPDLYVWPPNHSDSQLYWYSIKGPGEVDRVEIDVPSTCHYQVEIEGITETAFRLDMAVTDSCTRTGGRAIDLPQAKTPRTVPLVNIVSEPPGTVVLPPQQTEKRIFLPSIIRQTD